MSTSRLALLLVTLAWLPAATTAGRADSPRIDAAVQDGVGRVWGIALGELYQWRQHDWQRMDLSPAAGAEPVALGLRPSGELLCLWNQANQTHWLSEQDGDALRVLGSFTGPLHQPELYADRAGDVWVTERGPHIYRLPPGGPAAPAYTFAPDQYFAAGRPNADWADYNPVHALDDGRGHIWFWSDCLGKHSFGANLRGVLLWDGHTFQPHPTLTGLSDQPLSVIVAKDAGHLWLTSDGLYAVDLAMLAVQRQPESEPEAFSGIEQVFAANGDWYVVSEPWGADQTEDFSGVLWRLQDGRWQRIITGLDWGNNHRYWNRPALTADGRLWLGSYGYGSWLVDMHPGDTPARPAVLDWRHGMPFFQADALFALGDGQRMAVAYGAGTVVLPAPASLAAAAPPAPSVSTFQAACPPVRDTHGRLWALTAFTDDTPAAWLTGRDDPSWTRYGPPDSHALYDTRGRLDSYLRFHTVALHRWDGQGWTRIPGPLDGEIYRLGRMQLWTDSRGRLWVVGQTLTKTAVYDPATAHWTLFPNFFNALLVQRTLPGLFHFLNPNDNLYGQASQPPNFSSDGRICFLSWPDQMFFYNGRAWRSWKRAEIDGNTNTYLGVAPFFDRAGHLCISIDQSLWQWTEGAGWHKTQAWAAPMRSRDAPPGSVTQNPDSVVQDDAGVSWLTWNGQLYRAMPGLCFPVFAPGQPQPFGTGSRRVLLAVLRGRDGGALLHTASAGLEEWVAVPAGVPPPTPRLTLRRNEVDSVTVLFADSAQPPLWYLWRLDGGAWSAPQHLPKVRLDWLPGGLHRAEAVALDDQFNRSPTPAATVFRIDVNPVARTTALVRQLGSTSDARRESAIAGLLHQPSAVAAAALRAARPHAGADTRWWIDAALQQLGSNANMPKGTP